MATRSKNFHHIAITSYQLTESSLSVVGEVSTGGSLAITIDAKSAIDKDNDVVDKDHPFIIETNIIVVGKSSENKDSSADAEEEEDVFTLSSKARGIFVVDENETISASDVNDYINYLAPQVYLPLREYVQETLLYMGVQGKLPYQTQYALSGIETKKK